jgi:hypothetical protein
MENLKSNEKAGSHSEQSFKKQSSFDPVCLMSDSVPLRKGIVKAV